MRDFSLSICRMNLTAGCNADCNCASVKYSPVCHEPSKTTFFSACHAGCRTILDDKLFGNCSCLPLGEPEQVGGHFEYLSSSKSSFILDQQMHVLDSQAFPMIFDKVKAGPCISDCKESYLFFVILSCVIQTLACSGKIGNVLVNYRSVEKRDKSFAQGVTLMIVSLFALIPGPIIYGAIIDSTCLIWEESCGTRGNCWFHHRENFRYLVNISSAGEYHKWVNGLHLVDESYLFGNRLDKKNNANIKSSAYYQSYLIGSVMRSNIVSLFSIIKNTLFILQDFP